MNGQQLAFEPFGSLDGVLSGAPIKIMPIGTFYRGKRKIEITSADLQQIAENLKAGLPRFRVPINENHAGSGKIGTVYDVAYDPQGADGPGLYATKYSLTEVGQKMVSEKRFDAVSPEMLWKKNDATYQDPQTGQQHDNVLVGLALTERPFFGHDHVALFSEKPEEGMTDSKPGKWQRFKDMMAQMLKIMDEPDDDEGAPAEAAQMPEMHSDDQPVDGFKDYDAETRKAMAGKGKALPDGSYPIANAQDLANAIQAIGRAKDASAAKAHIIKRAKALKLTDKLPPGWAGSTQEKTHDTQSQEAEHMDKQNEAPPEAFTVKAEEFAALQAKAAKVDELTSRLDQFTAQLKETETQLSKTKRERDLDRMVQHADQFVAIPGTASEIGEKLLQLQEKDPDLFKWVDGLLTTLDKQLTQSELFAQRTTDRVEDGVDSFESLIEKLLVEKFDGDKAKYADAMKLAGSQRPDLAREYVRQGQGG